MIRIKDPKIAIRIANAALLKPADDKLIVYSSKRLTENGDNVGELLPVIAASPAAEGCTHVVGVESFDEALEKYREKHSFGDNVRFVCRNSEEFITALHTAKRLISDGDLMACYVRRREQQHLNVLSRRLLLSGETGNELRRGAAMSTLLTFENNEIRRLLERLLFTADASELKLINAALPEFFAKAPEPAATTGKSNAAGYKYTPEKIRALREKYFPAEGTDRETEEPDILKSITGFPEEESSKAAILEALFPNEAAEAEAAGTDKAEGRRKLLILADLSRATDNALELRNLAGRLDPEKFSVTVCSVKQWDEELCRSFSENVRLTALSGCLPDYDACKRQLSDLNSGGESFTEDYLFRLEILRSTGCTDYKDILLYETGDLFILDMCAALPAERISFAAVSEEGFLKSCKDPKAVTEKINSLCGRILTAVGGIERFDPEKAGRLPIVYSESWRRARHSDEEFKTTVFKGKSYYQLQNCIRPLAGCTLVPAPENWEDTYFCPVASEEDAAAVAKLFAEFKETKPGVKLYLHILTDSKLGLSFTGNENEGVTVTSGSRLPLLLIARCSCFAYPYTVDCGLRSLARLAGTRAIRPEGLTLLRAALAGPENGALYSEFDPVLPDKPELQKDISFFGGTLMTDDELEGYEASVTLAANQQLF